MTNHQRPWHRLLARWRSYALDARLAAGASPHQHRVSAVRADMLVEPAMRLKLARAWENLLLSADVTRRPNNPRLPLRRARILAAEPDIRRMTAALRAPLPAPARGVAMASVLLMDGAGPLYNARGQVDLGTAVRAATRFLDPSAVGSGRQSV